jgi:hypothetical protein
MPILSILILLLIPFSAHAETDFDDFGYLHYTDVDKYHESAIALNLLTRNKIIQGNPDGSFKPESNLNRAEFTMIVMRLLGEELSVPEKPCFPDVSLAEWYAPAVCAAKERGIVRGNADPNLSQEQWNFAPSRTVQYEEAAKILAELYEYDVEEATESEQWYAPYLRAVNEHGTMLELLNAGKKLVRGEMARLTARFVVEDEGELDRYIRSENMSTKIAKIHTTPTEVKAPSTPTREEVFELTQTNVLNGIRYLKIPLAEDKLPISTDQTWNICIRRHLSSNNAILGKECDATKENYTQLWRTVINLGGRIPAHSWKHPDLEIWFEANPMTPHLLEKRYILLDNDTSAGGIFDIEEKIIEMNTADRFIAPGSTETIARFSVQNTAQNFISGNVGTNLKHEVHVENIEIEFAQVGFKLERLEVHSEDGELLGEADHVFGKKYSLTPPRNKHTTIPFAGNFNISLIAKLKGQDGYKTNTTPIIQVGRISVTGDRRWQDSGFSETVHSEEEFPILLITDTSITSIKNTLDITEDLPEGKDIQIGAFGINSDVRASDGTPQIQEMRFIVELENVAIKDVYISADDTEEKSMCEAGKTNMRCRSLPSSIGVLRPGGKTFSLNGTVDHLGGSGSAKITLEQFGTHESEGSITWTDGRNIFDWIPGIEGPINGPALSYTLE